MAGGEAECYFAALPKTSGIYPQNFTTARAIT